MRPTVGAAERWLLSPGSARHLALVRIAVGCYAVGWLVLLSPELVALGDLGPARFDPVGPVALLGLRPASTLTIAVVVTVTAIAGCAFAAGWQFRITAPVFAVGLLLLTTYQNSWGKLLHTENLLVVHVLVLAASPAGDTLALGRRSRDVTSARFGWPVRVLALATLGAYVVAGTTKLRYAGWDWVDPENLRNWVAYDLVRKELFDDPYLPIAVPLLEHAWAFAPVVLFTLLVELGAPLALASRRAAWAWVAAAWSLHVAVLLVMSVAFPYQLSAIPLGTVLLAAGERTRVPTRPRRARDRGWPRATANPSRAG